MHALHAVPQIAQFSTDGSGALTDPPSTDQTTEGEAKP